MPSSEVQNMLELAKWHWKKREYDRAETVCRQVLAIDPKNLRVFTMLADLAGRGQRPQVALSLLKQAAAIDGRDLEVQISLGNAQMAMKMYDEAAVTFRRAIEIDPQSLPAHSNLSVALKEAGRMEEAIAVLRRVVALRPDHAEALAVLANAVSSSGRVLESLGFYERSLALAPNVPATRVNYACALRFAGRPAEGAAECQRGIDLGFHSAEAYTALAHCLRACDRLEEALAAYRQAITLRPDFSPFYVNLGVALRFAGSLDEAIASYQKAIELDPDNAAAHNVLGNALCDRGRRPEGLASYRRALELNPKLVAAHDNLVYMLYFNPDQTPASIYEEHRKWNEIHALAHWDRRGEFKNDRSAERVLNIGYVSSDFRNHVVGLNLLPLFLNHDHSRYHITCYANLHRSDEITERFKPCADVWREIHGMPDEDVVAQIREDQIDILVDLSLHMAGNRLMIFAYKPAPVQVTFAGYPGTTGMTAIDYRLTDPYLDPPGSGDAVYSEQSIRLPHSFWVYCPMTTEPRVNELPALKNGHVTFGCLNNFSKLNELTLNWWSKVLAAVPDSRLILLAPRGIQRQEAVQALNVSPDRVEFLGYVPRPEYLAFYHRIDIGLDSFPYNGHTTSLDALWMGVPVVSWCGQTAVSRAGFSQASNIGLTELVAQNADDCVRLAVDLARDLPRLAELRRTLRGRLEQSPLGDPKGFTQGIEAAYRQIWRKWCENAGGAERH